MTSGSWYAEKQARSPCSRAHLRHLLPRLLDAALAPVLADRDVQLVEADAAQAHDDLREYDFDKV